MKKCKGKVSYFEKSKSKRQCLTCVVVNLSFHFNIGFFVFPLNWISLKLLSKRKFPTAVFTKEPKGQERSRDLLSSWGHGFHRCFYNHDMANNWTFCGGCLVGLNQLKLHVHFVHPFAPEKPITAPWRFRSFLHLSDIISFDGQRQLCR